MNSIHRLQQQGQSVWLDNIQRKLLTSGELQRMIVEDGICGITSNPTIFEKAIGGSNDYDAALTGALARDANQSVEDLFFELAIEDIQAAADLLRPVYESSQCRDGMVSLEVSPALAYQADATLDEALSLWKRVNRPNLMIKVPATREGVPAIEALTAAGVNVNATLLFSVDRYHDVAEAFMRGLEARLRRGLSVTRIASVASFFISRVDSVIDKQLQQRIDQHPVEQSQLGGLCGQAAIANAKLAYQVYLELFSSERFMRLREAGARSQRLLWASTGVKNPAFSDVLYVDSLIGAETVNTLPPATLQAYLDHGDPQPTLMQNVDEARQLLAQLRDMDIDIETVATELEAQGVLQFQASFRALLDVIDSKVSAITGNIRAHG